MNREALDEFFAKADDVLADWAPSDDAMVARVDDEGADLPVADSYYAQSLPRFSSVFAGPVGASPTMLERDGWQPLGWVDEAALHERMLANPQLIREAMQGIQDAIGEGIVAMRDAFAAIGQAYGSLPASVRTNLGAIQPSSSKSPQARALRLRRERNTGPTDRHGLDGHLRRRRTQ